ncbi:hypothetical protein Rhow_000302 [Rhodococcus wratislaviensis]|uniref:Uncharacterized protein n=1 Tax=Rhodococcus wratislaviensis TaxID=44752 RepID=A0A402CMA9_RHOWR|nr:hypothetical protein Rhow_000302 [Rhodococcus wratislaviensis]
MRQKLSTCYLNSRAEGVTIDACRIGPLRSTACRGDRPGFDL